MISANSALANGGGSFAAGVQHTFAQHRMTEPSQQHAKHTHTTHLVSWIRNRRPRPVPIANPSDFHVVVWRDQPLLNIPARL